MNHGVISAVLPPAAIAAIVAALEVLKKFLPFLIALDPERRRTMLKLGPGRVKFVQSIRVLADKNPEMIPSVIDLAEFGKDADLLTALEGFAPVLTQISEGVDDTRMAAGSEALEVALQLYGVFQSVSRTVPGLDDNLKDIGAGFKPKSRKAKSEGTK